MARNETIMNQIKNYVTSPYKDGDSPEKEIKFWKTNYKKIKKMIEWNELSKGDFQTITKAMNKLYRNHLETTNYKTIEPELLDICKMYISLSLKNYEKIDKYLILFDSWSAYYKRIKALAKFWLYKWPIEWLNFLFQDICTLLWEAMELEPEKSKECINIMKQYLKILYNTTIFGDSEKFSFRRKYTNSKYWKNFLNNKEFKERFEWINEDDERLTNSNWIKEIINEIIEEYENWRMPSKATIMQNIKPMMDEYKNIEKEYEEQNKIVDNIRNEYEEFMNWDYKKYTPNEEHDADIVWVVDEMWQDIENEKELRNDAIELKIQAYTETLKKGWKVLLQIDEERDTETKEKIKNKYKNLFKEYEDSIDFREVPENKNLWRIVAQQWTYEWRLNEEWNKQIWLYEWLKELWNKILEKVTEICYNSKHWIKQDIIKEDSEENDEDKENVENIKECAEQMHNKIKWYEKLIKELENESAKLVLYNEDLKELLRKNWIEFNDHWESEKRRKRSTYRILVVWWREGRNRKYSEMVKEGKINNYLEILWLIPSQLPKEAKRDYDEQRNNDELVKSIKNELDKPVNPTDIVIILQTDHGTELYDNLLKDPRYRQRITYFWEVDEQGRRVWNNISNKWQHFSYLMFKNHLKAAIEKFENTIDIDDIN